MKSASAAVFALLVCVGCGAEQLEAEGEGTAPTSIVDPETGRIIPLNYEAPEGPPVYEDPNAVSVKNLSTGFQEVVVGSGEDDASLNLQQNRLVVGVGAGVGGDDVITLWLHGRSHNPDGTLGVVTEFRGGNQPNTPIEVFCAAPTGHVMVGVGGRIDINHDFTTLHIWTRAYNVTTRRLEGQVFEKRCGTVPDHVLESRLVTWEHVPDEQEDVTVINGIGFRDRDNTLVRIRGRLRTMQ